MSQVQPGWYQDPKGPRGHLRYWDGNRWTEHQKPHLPAASSGAAGRKEWAWIRRHKRVAALVAVALIGWTMDAAAGDEQPADNSAVTDVESPTSSDAEPGTDPLADESRDAEPAKTSGDSDKGDARPAGGPRDKQQGDQATAKPSSEPKPSSKPKPAPNKLSYLVRRIIDGDTIELGNGAAVRIVGIDTPEVGQCGYEAASSNMARLVLNKQVRLVLSDEDKDYYGRWLRYVDVGVMDAGLQQIKGGFAIARYDSRDGYGFHVREPSYVAADHASKNLSCSKPAPVAAPANNAGGGTCAPGYKPCVPPSPPDVDCADVNGPIQVSGTDPHGLDADGDGVACE